MVRFYTAHTLIADLLGKAFVHNPGLTVRVTDTLPRPTISDEKNKQEQAPLLEEIKISKNPSSGIVSLSSGKAVVDGKYQASYDAVSTPALDTSIRSPPIQEHEHGAGISGLRRIRQQPASRAPSHPPSPTTPYSLPTRSSSMTLGLSSNHGAATGTASSLAFKFSEDLTRFPSESLHSFSFAHQSEDTLHNRQAVLRRALDFMQNRLGLSSDQLSVMAAQAKLTGDAEIEGMMDLLVRANLLGGDASLAVKRQPPGPMTGPVDVEGNVFEYAFFSRIEEPRGPVSVDGHDNKILPIDGSEPSRSSSGPEPSLGSEASAPEPSEPLSPLLAPNDGTRSQNAATKGGLRRTFTDMALVSLENRLVEALAKPYRATDGDSQGNPRTDSMSFSQTPAAAEVGSYAQNLVHGHNNRWVPAAQAIFTTEVSSPWTILAANDLACLIFGVTKAEVKKLSMLEFVREGRREWLQEKLKSRVPTTSGKDRRASPSTKSNSSSGTTSTLSMSGGITAQLLSKPSWRLQRAQTEGSSSRKQSTSQNPPSGGVLLCGDIVPIQKRNGATGAASLWVKEKNTSLIWVLEQIAEDVASLALDEDANVLRASGASSLIWGRSTVLNGKPICDLIPGLPLVDGYAVDKIAVEENEDAKYYGTKSAEGACVPVSVFIEPATRVLRVSCFPHIAGIVVVSALSREVISANSVFSAALFGRSDLRGEKIRNLLPQFEDVLEYLTEAEKLRLDDGIVVPEHSFRRARALLAAREGKLGASDIFFNSCGLTAQHRDGSEINVDVQMRIVQSRSQKGEEVIEEETETDDETEGAGEVVYALWITYSRYLHSKIHRDGRVSPMMSRPESPVGQPSPGQASGTQSPVPVDQEEMRSGDSLSTLAAKIEEAASQPISDAITAQEADVEIEAIGPPKSTPRTNKKIEDFVILEDMGQGAYGQVKLARAERGTGKKVVLKYVTKKKILVDTWTRDRRLGTVPLEIHVLDYLRRDGLRHPNIVEMIDFFEDDINYYIEMVPHGLTGMDLFDYIEVRTSMDEAECRNIFLQVVAALHHLHTKALVVHQDIKDENIILDGEAHVKLIDFGSAAYIKNGPFDVFVGTIGEFAAPSARTRLTVPRLCCPRGSAGEIVPGQGTRHLGLGNPALHARVQGEPVLQHR